MQGKVEISGINTAQLKTLKNDEMVRLLRLSRAGDEAARQKLIEGNLRLVLSVIQKFLGRGESPDDLFQVGCVGLLKAIANFDVDLNVKFSTYGVPMIGATTAHCASVAACVIRPTAFYSAARPCLPKIPESRALPTLPNSWSCPRRRS